MTYVLIDDRVINLMAISTIRIFTPLEGTYIPSETHLEIVMISGETIRYSGDGAETVWKHLSKMATPLEKF